MTRYNPPPYINPITNEEEDPKDYADMEDFEYEDCWTCRGTGEGQVDGFNCPDCKGSGQHSLDIILKTVIDFNKPVRQVNGNKVRILCTDAKDRCYPVIGLIYKKERETACSWTIEGKMHADASNRYDGDLTNYEY